jgi:hypothetical protein
LNDKQKRAALQARITEIVDEMSGADFGSIPEETISARKAEMERIFAKMAEIDAAAEQGRTRQ